MGSLIDLQSLEQNLNFFLGVDLLLLCAFIVILKSGVSLVEVITDADKAFYSVIVSTYQEPAYVRDSKETRSSKALAIEPVSLWNMRGETNQTLVKMSALNDLILRNPALYYMFALEAYL